MGTLFSALDIGRAGLSVAQVQLDTAGHNISNVNKTGYSRQRVELTTRLPIQKHYGFIGRGPAIDGIRRIREPFLDEVFRQQIPGLGRTELRANYFSRLEDIFQEPSPDGFGNRLGLFFDALSDFANNVEDLPVRQALLAEGQAVAGSLNQAAQQLRTLRTNANEEVRNLVPQINSIAQRIAELNRTISNGELGGQVANDLRDDRDVLLDQLSRIVNIDYRERDDGQVDVLLGGESLVNGVRTRPLEAVIDPSIDPNRPDLLRVQFADTGQEIFITNGELLGAIQIRDIEIAAVEDRLDEIARGLIQNINRIHSQGNGLENISQPLTSSNGALAPNGPLNLVGLPFPVTDGSFDIVVYDNAGNIQDTVTIPIVASGPNAGQTELSEIEAAINASTGTSGLTASINADGQLTITPGAGTTMSFANDTSGALTALGVNTFFTGRDASTISVNDFIEANPEYISSGFSTDPLETGDNSAALAMAALRTAPILDGNTQTVAEFYESTIVQLGIDARANGDLLTVEANFAEDFERRRQEVSGVNIDEEVTFLLQFQRAFEGSARVITTADRMLETLLNIVQ